MAAAEAPAAERGGHGKLHRRGRASTTELEAKLEDRPKEGHRRRAKTGDGDDERPKRGHRERERSSPTRSPSPKGGGLEEPAKAAWSSIQGIFARGTEESKEESTSVSEALVGGVGSFMSLWKR